MTAKPTPFVCQFTYTDRQTEDPEHSVLVATHADPETGEILKTAGPMPATKAETEYGLDCSLEALAGLSATTMQAALTAALAQVETLTEQKLVIAQNLEQVTADGLTKDAMIVELQSQLVALNGETIDGVPQVISKMQGRMILAQNDLLDDVEAYMAAQPAISPVRIYYQDAADWHRDHPMIDTLASQLGLTGEQVDQMFIAAKQIV